MLASLDCPPVVSWHPEMYVEKPARVAARLRGGAAARHVCCNNSFAWTIVVSARQPATGPTALCIAGWWRDPRGSPSSAPQGASAGAVEHFDVHELAHAASWR